MSGHSHWAGIKHQKEASDAKKGKVFSKISKDIMLAVRESGADPETNIKLRYAMDKAREANMPKANVEKAIKKMTGEDGAISLQELVYEGYGPGGTAIMVEVVTDNRNRVNSELRKIFDTRGGKMGESGCVSYLFDKKGLIIVEGTIDEEKLMGIIMEAEAEDMKKEGDVFEITTSPVAFQKVRMALEAAQIPTVSAEITAIPKTTVVITDETVATKLMTLLNIFEDHDDVQNVYCNHDISDELMEKINEE